MCGIAGQVNFAWDRSASNDSLARMLGCMDHRGPDGDGVHLSGPVGLGHKRLTIIDLHSGAQPLCNEDQTVWVTFNGEIYNYQQLTEELRQKGHRFSSSSDTEVLVHLWEEHGPEMVHKLTGMFSFAIWDSNKREVFIARDRVGIKPVYWTMTKSAMLFASELKPLIAYPDFEKELDIESVDRFLAFDYLPGDRTLLGNVKKLEPGHSIIARYENGKLSSPKIEQWWDLPFSNSSRTNSTAGFDDNCRELDSLLEGVVADHMISDVPVGLLLSGGLDSTAILDYASRHADTDFSTYTVGFDDPSGRIPDERKWARIAASKYGTRHNEISVRPDAFRSFLPEYVNIMEEPVCEPPAIALHYVCQLASRDVKVVLSGEGGDEAFAGYKTYARQLQLEKLSGALPGWIKQMAGSRFGRRVSPWLPRLNLELSEHYFSRTSHPFRWYPENCNSLWSASSLRELTPLQDTRTFIADLFSNVSGESTLSKMLYVDSKTWLPDDLLVKADKISMASSLELRVPLLDHRVLEFAATRADSHKLQGNTNKRLLRRVCEKRVPQEILDRPKTGFPVPYESWLQNELFDYVFDTLTSSKAKTSNLFDRSFISSFLLSFRKNPVNAKDVFKLLIFELWCQQFLA